MYEQNSTNSTYADYGEVVSLINEKLINVNMGGSRDTSGALVVLEAVSVEGNYVPKIGDWVTVSWRNGQPVATGGNSNGMSNGLVNINNEVKIVSQTDMANGVVNSEHIRANTIEAVHIKAQAIEAYHISANAITAVAISANSITSEKIAASAITAQHISANAITGDKIDSETITARNISANAITGDKIAALTISANNIAANSIDASKFTASAKEFGLLGQYFTHSGGENKFEVFKGSRVEGPINFDWGTGSPSIVGKADNYSVRWQGMIFAPVAGQYTFYISVDDGAKVWVDNNLIIDKSLGNDSGIISLDRDKWYTIRIDYYENTGNAWVKLEWEAPSLSREIIPARYMTQAQTVIDGGTILTNTITASAIKVGTITAASGVIGDAAITNANIVNGAITSAKIGNAEIKTAHIASGNITTALIADASITNAKIKELDAGKITTGYISADVIAAGSIVGAMISANTITGNKIAVNTIDTNNLKAGSVTATKIAAGAITGEKIAAETITSEKLRAGSISAEHISAKGLDANLINVYNSQTGQVLIGGGYVRVDGLDVGVVQSDNLIGNGLFLTASSAYGMKRDNQAGEAILGSVSNVPGAHEVWKIDAVTGQKIATLGIPAKKPVDFAIDAEGKYAYVTVQGDNSLVQVDLQNFTLTGEKLQVGIGPSNLLYTGDKLQDMKHFFVINNDPSDVNIPDSVVVIDAPPASVDNDLYVHHWWEVGNTPYDMVLDDKLMLYITQAGQGDIAMVDVSDHNSKKWKVVGNIPIAAYMTDNYHGGLSGVFGLGVAVGGDASAAYDENAKQGASTENSEHAHHVHSGYGAPTGSLKQYEPHGIALSSDPETLYVCDFKNNELLVVDKYGKAPYNDLTGLHSQGNMGSMPMPGSPHGGGEDHAGHTMSMSMDMDMDTGHSMNDGSPATAMFMEGGGPTTNYVRYRIPIGNSPDYVTVKDGKVFVSLQGAGKIAVIDEQDILDEIAADRAFYYAQSGDIPYGEFPFNPMRELPTFTVRTIDVGSKPSKMVDGGNGLLYALISAQSQVARINTATETFTTINVGPNPKGICFSNDKSSFYVVNHGGSGDLSFVYPNGPYIGDAFLGLEGGISLQGADFWIPDRSDWIYGPDGRVRSYSTIEFRINEPFLNEGGYVRMALIGKDYQYTQIEQDIFTVTNYSNGDNLVVSTNERLIPLDATNKNFQPQNPWLETPKPTFKIEVPISGGGYSVIIPSSSSYAVTYGTDSVVKFNDGIVPEGGFVTSTYTARNNLYFKPHNGSLLIATENGSSPNFDTTFEIDEFVPKFIVLDNQQTSKFTPIEDGVNEEYSGLEYSMKTNRAYKIPVSQITVSGGTITDRSLLGRVVNGDFSPDNHYSPGSGKASITLDLGKAYMVGMIHVLHYYADGRTYHNTKTEISEDGIKWKTVFDSAVQGEYAENTMGMPKMHMFDFTPVRYIRDTTNGSTANTGNHWIQIEAFGDWEVEYNYKYPVGSEMAGQQMATNGKCVVTTDIQDAYVAYDAQIEFTSWWYMTYIVGPEFGRLKVEMPSMGGDHFLTLDAPYLNKIAHRHIMTWTPSENIKADASTGVKAGKHRAIVRQVSGKISLDRFRIEDYQFYARNSLLTTNQTVSSYSRKKIVAEQAKWYEGKGRQATEGAYDTPRKNPDTGVPDKSVPLKYRFRVKAELNANGSSEERGVAYVTSAIFETGKLHTNWRRSESIDSIPSNKIQNWDANQPSNTGIQTQHLANGSVRGPKILPHAIMDYHISPYARIKESKLNLKYPTHTHRNKMVLDLIEGFAGTGGAYGVSNTIARGDHKHDYLALSGGQIIGSLNISGNFTINGKPIATDWASITGKPTSFPPASHNHTVANITDLATKYYDKTQVDSMVAGAGDIRAASANVFTNMNIFNHGGLALKVQPSVNVSGGTTLVSVNNFSGESLFGVKHNGDITIPGNLIVQGTTQYAGTQNINGDYNVNGNLSVSGNTTLGDASSDTVNVKATLILANQGTATNHAVRADRVINTGAGLLGGGNLTANRTLSVNFGGNGTATTVSRSDHNHDTAYLGVSGTAINSNKLGDIDALEYVKRDGSVAMTGKFNAKDLSVAGALTHGMRFEKYVGSFNGTNDTNTRKVDLYIPYNFFGTFEVMVNGHWSNLNAVGLVVKQFTFASNGANKINYISERYTEATGGTKNVVAIGTAVWDDALQVFKIPIALRIPSHNLYSVIVRGYGIRDSYSEVMLGTLSLGPVYDTDATVYPLAKQQLEDDAQTRSGYTLYHSNNLDTTKMLKSDTVGQSVNGSFTIAGDGDLWVGAPTAGSAGQVVVRDANGINRIQLDGGNTGKITGINTYLDGSGNAQLAGKLSANTIAVVSRELVTNLNTELIDGVKESSLAKNESILELGGKGVYSGLSVTAQLVPNMTVRVSEGIVYTDSGRRFSHATKSVSLSASSATYSRIDAIYVRGSSSGANEGALAVAAGTPSAKPAAPTLPVDAVLLALVTVGKNIGSILDANIQDARGFRALNCDANNNVIWLPDSAKLQTNRIFSNGASNILVDKPIRANGWAVSLTIPAGSSSITWNHSLGQGSYAVTWSTNSPNRHVFWSNKTSNAVTLNIDDATDVDTIIDAVITAY